MVALPGEGTVPPLPSSCTGLRVSSEKPPTWMGLAQRSGMLSVAVKAQKKVSS